MKAAWDRSGEYYDPARKEDTLGRTTNPSGIVGRTPQGPVGGTGESAGMFWRMPTGFGIWFHSFSLPAFVVAMALSIAGAENLQRMWEGA